MGRLTKGMIIGGMIGTAIGMMAAPEVLNTNMSKRMLRNKKSILRKTGEALGSAISSIK